MRHLDLFSGIGGFSKGLKDAGLDITRTQFSEVDKYAISVYQNQFKEAEYVGSVTDVQGTRGQADIITFGSPCQDFSLAGKRKGMDGDRSSLISHAIRLISEIRPEFFIWENVKGAFSSNNGADFWGIIQAFANIGGYRLEWQLLNTSWFLPQNRERIYLVGCLGKGSGRAIFPIGEGIKEADIGIEVVGNTNNSGHGERSVVHGIGGNMSCLTSTDYKQPKQIMIPEPTKTSVQKDNVIASPRIRRLTPIECERLQGFPDNWTQYGHDGKEISDTQRYKMCGNAISIPVVAAVGKSIRRLSE